MSIDRRRFSHSIEIFRSDMSGAMKLLFAVAVAVCLAQATFAKTPRSTTTTAAPATKPQLEDVVSRAQDSLSNVSSQITNLLGLDNLPQTQDEVVKVLNTQSTNLKNKIEEYIGAIDKEVKAHSDSGFTDLLATITARLNATVTSLQDAAPGVTKGATEIQAQIQSGLNVVVEEAGKLAKALGGEASAVQEDLDKLTRTAVEQAVSIGKQVEEKVKTAIEEHQATHA